MFKILSGRTEPAGFDDSVVIVNLSQFWLSVSADGDQIPPAGLAAMDSASVAASPKIRELVADNLLEILGGQTGAADRPKKKKRAEAAPEEPLPTQPDEPNLDTVTISEKIQDTSLVADPVEEKQVLLENNIDNPD